jgi:hypothetical protein
LSTINAFLLQGNLVGTNLIQPTLFSWPIVRMRGGIARGLWRKFWMGCCQSSPGFGQIGHGTRAGTCTCADASPDTSPDTSNDTGTDTDTDTSSDTRTCS